MEQRRLLDSLTRWNILVRSHSDQRRLASPTATSRSEFIRSKPFAARLRLPCHSHLR
ncbi:hypothetical protein [Microvirga sesbaniae]|uniref:hypothetical protein n=1 Tax=Microvirga sesbaniae TaxID=681392 RepID=UPI00358DB642